MVLNETKILENWLEGRKKVVITTHQKPDADALGSSLALANYLIKYGHDVLVISPTDYPSFLDWMPGSENVVIYSDTLKDQIKQSVITADLIFCLDFSSLNRIKEVGEFVKIAPGKKILIDHHMEPEQFADFSRWSTKAAATCELVFELMADMGRSEFIDQGIANCLYAGIMTDTGNFKHPNVTKNVFRICSELVEYGADTGYVARNIYDTNTVNRLHLLGYSLKEKLIVHPELEMAYIALTKKELNQFHYQTGDTEGIVNYALSIQGIRVAALFTDRNEMIKISFRSSGNYSVNQLARDHFNGGGHKNASGGQSNLTLEETVEKFIKVITETKY